MKVTFVSNYINHHQVPFCEAMHKRLKEDYCFIQTQPMEEERIRMGWDASLADLPYVRKYYEAEAVCEELIEQSDVVLFGGVEDESYILKRLKSGKPVVRLSERIYKEGQWKAISPRGLLKKYKDHTRYRDRQLYLLCCGGYVPSDFHLVRAYPDKMFKWGYFPECITQDIDGLLMKKRSRKEAEGKVSLLWAGRFIDWKHPEHAIEAAARLKREGFRFTLTMAGGGEMEEALKALAEREGLEDAVRFTGFLKPAEVRALMEQADVYLFTSDYREGWGAVLNEAMNSGCAVVANCAIGAVPFLIKPGKNGLIYPNGKQDLLYESLVSLLRKPERMEALGRAAYHTIAQEWNAKEAANRLVPFLQDLLQGRVSPKEEGILSPAPVISPRRMYRYMNSKAKTRIYVCHTLYHVYVTMLKEMNLPEEEKQKGRADIALSTLFMDFEDLGERLEASGLFENVLVLDERRDEEFPELMKYKQNRHNILKHLFNRLIYTKKYGKIQEQFIDIPFEDYADIYVFCDSDPIGYYLSYRHIYYHAVEDGLDCLKNFDAAHVDNRGHFRLKAALAACNLIFIQNGYAKYCLDMEINDKSVLPYTFKKYKEVPRQILEQALSSEQKQIMLRVFLPDAGQIAEQLADCSDCVLFLTEAFPQDASVRKAVADEILRDYCGDAKVVIKPHPRDDLDYTALYPQCITIRGKFPIEVLNFIEGIHFKKAISIITSSLGTIDFAKEKINIGPQIWDAYEPEEVHAFMKEAWERQHTTGS